VHEFRGAGSRAALAAVLCAASPCSPACAGAFNPAAGEGVAIVSTTFTDGRDYVDGAGRKWRAPRFSKFETQAHVEYGVTDWLAAIARPRFASIHEDGRKGFRGEGFRGEGFRGEGVGASEFGAQARLFGNGAWVAAAQALARTPASPGGRFSTWEDRGGVEGRLLVGRSFAAFGVPGYLDMEVGVRTRGGRADEVVAEQTIGLRPTPALLVTLQTFSTQTIESQKRRLARGAPQGERRLKAQIGLVYDFASKWSIGAALSRTVYVRDGARETGATFSLWRRF
jgi:hypothetical protein